MEERFDKQTQERAVLVGLNADCFAEEETATESTLDELEDLVSNLGIGIVGKHLVKSRDMHAKFLCGTASSRFMLR